MSARSDPELVRYLTLVSVLPIDAPPAFWDEGAIGAYVHGVLIGRSRADVRAAMDVALAKLGLKVDEIDFIEGYDAAMLKRNLSADIRALENEVTIDAPVAWATFHTYERDED